MIFYVFFLQPIELYSGPSPPEGLVCEATGLVLTNCICETYFAKWGGTHICILRIIIGQMGCHRRGWYVPPLHTSKGFGVIGTLV